MKIKFLLYAAILILPLGIAGCASFSFWQQKPIIMVTNFQVLTSADLAPNFKIGLHIINPNRMALELEGLYYTIAIDGHEIVEGVSNRLPTIGAYDVGDLEIEAKANMINSLRLIADLVHNARDSYNYTLKAEISVGMFVPSIHVIKEGTVSLQALTR